MNEKYRWQMLHKEHLLLLLFVPTLTAATVSVMKQILVPEEMLDNPDSFC